MAKDLNYFKKKLLAILDQKEREEKGISKSLAMAEFIHNMASTFGSIEKGASLPIGTKKEWPNGSGKWYIKTGTGWIRTYNNSNSRGAKQSIAYTKKKIQNAKSLEELLAIVEQNKDKFTDDNGKRLDIVKELMQEVHSKHQEFKGGKAPAAATPVKTPEATTEPKKRKYDRPMDQKMIDNYKDEAFGMRMRTTEYGKNLDAGKEAMEKFINDKKELMAGNQKDIDAGKDPEGKLEEYNRYYEKQIEAYQKELDRLNNDIKARDEKKAAAKKAREEKKAAKEAEKKKQEEIEKYKKLQEELKAEITDFDKRPTRELKDDVKEWKDLENEPSFTDEHKKHMTEIIKIGEAELKRREEMNNSLPIKEGQKIYYQGREFEFRGYSSGGKIIAGDGMVLISWKDKEDLENDLKTGEISTTKEAPESEAEKHQNRSDAMKGNQNAKKDGVPEEETKTNNTPTDPEAIRSEMKKVNDLFTKYVTDYDTFGTALRADSRADTHSKAYRRAKGISLLKKAKEDLEKEGFSMPEVPQLLLDKLDEYEKANAADTGYFKTAGDKILSGIKQSYIDEVVDSFKKPLKDKYKELKDSLPKADIPTIVTPLPNLSNEEHANLIEFKKDPDATSSDYNMRLYYNGKPYGDNGGYSDTYFAKQVLADQQDLIRNAGMNPTDQFNYMLKKIGDNRDYYIGDKSSFRSALKKKGEKELKKIKEPTTMSDEEFNEKLLAAMKEKTRAAEWIKEQLTKHYTSKRWEEVAEEVYNEKYGEDGASGALNGVDLPVDPKDMDEAKKLIASDVAYITGGGKWLSTTRATLKDKIERRVRNNPALARAMLVYIKEQQQETGKTVFTDRNEIWETLVKLNKNAMDAVMEGKEETNRESSGNMYSGDGISSVVNNREAGRYQITFTGKPDYETRTLLKQNGFRWAPSTGTWQCYNTSNGEYSLKRVAEKLGWKKE